MKTENTQHTPGPWKTQRAHSGRIVYKETQRNFETNETRILAFLVRNEAQFPVEDSDANGHLIAAAPDLLSAAINALALLAQIDAICITGKQPAFGVIRELARDAAGPVRVAIARATGKEGAK